MKREIFLKLTIDWDDYEDVSDEIIIEDSGIYDALKDGVNIEIIANEPEQTIIID